MMLYLQNIKNMKQKMYDKHKKQMTIFRLNYLGYMFFFRNSNYHPGTNSHEQL